MLIGAQRDHHPSDSKLIGFPGRDLLPAINLEPVGVQWSNGIKYGSASGQAECMALPSFPHFRG